MIKAHNLACKRLPSAVRRSELHTVVIFGGRMIDFGYEKEDKEKSEWASEGYVSDRCPNCRRHRLEKCANGKHWCEKCNWVVEDDKHFVPDWRI